MESLRPCSTAPLSSNRSSRCEKLSLQEYKRLYRFASELGDRAELDRLQTRYVIDDNGATPKPRDDR